MDSGRKKRARMQKKGKENKGEISKGCRVPWEQGFF
jgi:hypothetical protein